MFKRCLKKFLFVFFQIHDEVEELLLNLICGADFAAKSIWDALPQMINVDDNIIINIKGLTLTFSINTFSFVKGGFIKKSQSLEIILSILHSQPPVDNIYLNSLYLLLHELEERSEISSLLMLINMQVKKKTN